MTSISYCLSGFARTLAVKDRDKTMATLAALPETCPHGCAGLGCKERCREYANGMLKRTKEWDRPEHVNTRRNR